ncbi:MAG TPA: hypothetical protein VLL27_14825 [Solirubrobacterales bacterium]|nr:hypothetical protein [Solirubrobacterales bacterium]
MKWNRIKRRVDSLERTWDINWFFSAASACVSLAVSLAVGGMMIAAALALILAVISLGFFLSERRGRRQQCCDIVDEMETEESAWTTARAARESGG